MKLKFEKVYKTFISAIYVYTDEAQSLNANFNFDIQDEGKKKKVATQNRIITRAN